MAPTAYPYPSRSTTQPLQRFPLVDELIFPFSCFNALTSIRCISSPISPFHLFISLPLRRMVEQRCVITLHGQRLAKITFIASMNSKSTTSELGKEAFIDLKELLPDKRNARKRTAQSAHLISESLKRYGAARSVVIDENNMLIAGHGTVEGARELGIKRVRVIESDGSELIAVRRTNWTEDQKIGANLADNRTSDLSEWDAEMLHSLSQETDVAPWFSQDDIQELLGKLDDDDIADDQSDELATTYSVLISCHDEIEQASTLETLTNQGFQCRALNS